MKSPGAIKVVDVSDPNAPTVVGALPINVSSENIHAVTTHKRALLVAAASGRPPVVHVWDVRNCTQPVLLGTIAFPGLSPENPAVVTQVHNIELTPDATKIYGSLPLQVADITNLADPSTWTVRSWQCEVAAQAPLGFQGILFAQTAFALDHPECANILVHEFEFNRSSTRMYIGGQLSGEFATQRDPLHRPWHTEQELRVVDITVSPPKILSSIPSAAGGHAVRRAKIGRRPFLLHSNENVNPDPTTVNGCIPDTSLPGAGGVAHAHLTDISDEFAPRTVSELELAINKPENCAAQLSSRVRASIHYNDVDDPDHTTFAMLPMGNAGLRVFDIRYPEAPFEVAYFNPGQYRLPDGSTTLDRAGNHIRYVPRAESCDDAKGWKNSWCKKRRNCKEGHRCKTGHIWLTTRIGGFWVLELEPQVRRALDLPFHPRAAEYPHGRPARPDLTSASIRKWSGNHLLAVDDSDHHH